ncbi:YceI family protein [bacterium]|nr:YceI family protein [bacterium]
MKRTILLTIFTALFAFGTTASASNWAIDKVHSNVGFDAKHLVISTVEGEFADYDATISFEPSDLSTLNVNFTVQIGSINTDNEKRDGHLKSADFFDVETYPTMTFKSTGVKVTAPGEAELTGDLTIRGVTKPVTFAVDGFNQPIEFMGTTKTGGTAKATINRQDFGVSWNKSLDAGGVLVSDDVNIVLELELDMQ